LYRGLECAKLTRVEKRAEGVRVSSRSRSVVLVCEECGERVVVVGSLSAWRLERAVFECGCGEGLTLADRLEEKTTELATVPSAMKPRRRC
jgi:hypothetical protein